MTVLETVEVTERVGVALPERHRVGEVEWVGESEGEGVPVLLTLPHLLTLEHPLPVAETEGEPQAVGVTEGVDDTVLVKQRVGD